MPKFVNHFQEIFYYFTSLLLLISVFRGFLGITQEKIFESKFIRQLRFIRLLVVFNFCLYLGVKIFEAFQQPEVNWNALLNVQSVLLFFTIVSCILGIEKIKSTLTQGKKFRAMFLYSGIALLLMMALIIYSKLF